MAETTPINISPIRPFDEAAALDWLRAQPGGRTTLKAADLGRRWGWGRHRPGRRIEAWIKAGKVTRRGNTIAIADDAAGPPPPPAGTGANGAPVPHGEKPAPPTGGEGVTNPNLVTPSVTPPTEHHSRRVTVATLMAALGSASSLRWHGSDGIMAM